MELLAETAVFVDTNLGTRFALSVPDNITAGDLKGKLKYEHNSCFPTLGKIIVHSLMVKQKSFFYHIPDSMLIKEACQGLGTWFLRIDASRLADITLQQEEMPPSINHIRRQDSCSHAETANPDVNKVLPLSNLIPPSNSVCCKPGDQFLCTKIAMDHKIEGSTSNIFDSHNSLKTMGFTISATNMRNHAGEIEGDCSRCNEGKVDVISSLIKRRKLPQNSQGNVTDREAVTIYKSVLSSGFDSGKEVIKGNAMMDEAPCANQKNIDQLSTQPERGQKENSFSREAAPSVNLSEEISVNGIIWRYFSNIDEVNSGGTLNKNVRDMESASLQLNSMLNIKKSPLIEETGCATKEVQYLADCDGFNESQSDCDTACSFIVTPSGANQVCPMSNVNTKNDKDKLTASGDKKQPKTIPSSVKNNNFVGSWSTYQANNNTSHKSKSQRASSRVNRKLVFSTPHLTPKFSAQGYKKSTRMLSSNSNRCEVGKRLVQAANKICSSGSAKKSPRSLISQHGNMSTPDSIIIVKRFSFEINDSDD
ncbi:hypothetical protein Cni_G27988 [Canna indica]|uniref:Uncharacterized protein n=1 Tax=Canna indica TaxID=4628 RepID=A0AAQ3QNG0_9LILI|nr:hypothetical protein Cni_G27988 [Canna indica]